MGIFDFLGNVGAKIFGKGKKEEEAIEELVNKDLPGKIQNLKAEFKDGVVTLTGQCDTYATREKAILLAGNVTGVKQVDDRLTSPPKEETTVFYTVKSGDSLSKIAKALMGNAQLWPKIFEANKEVIKNPDLIYPGQQLRIPKV
ncbi:peptidoglycan-binding protein LysM [bacterium]|nr:peptidoglycan-binding protein LysM [bacterium]